MMYQSGSALCHCVSQLLLGDEGEGRGVFLENVQLWQYNKSCRESNQVCFRVTCFRVKKKKKNNKYTIGRRGESRKIYFSERSHKRNPEPHHLSTNTSSYLRAHCCQTLKYHSSLVSKRSQPRADSTTNQLPFQCHVQEVTDGSCALKPQKKTRSNRSLTSLATAAASTLISVAAVAGRFLIVTVVPRNDLEDKKKINKTDWSTQFILNLPHSIWCARLALLKTQEEKKACQL